MKKLTTVLFFVFTLSVSISSAEAGRSTGWEIDGSIKFSASGMFSLKSDSSDFLTPVLEPHYLPDIDNIMLSGLQSLGFDIPYSGRADDKKYYIKLYSFPVTIDLKKFTGNFNRDFRLDSAGYFPSLMKYISDRNNIQVKFARILPDSAVFSKKNPFPGFSAGKDSDSFVNDVLFYSVYLKPVQEKPVKASDDALADWSRQGVPSFREDLIVYYKKNFHELRGMTPDNNYFLIGQTKSSVRIVVVPKVLMFDNWRNLPMPQDPRYIFLTSLLLVYSNEYVLNNGKKFPDTVPTVDSPDFKLVFSKKRTKILEVASVLNLNQKY